MIRAMPSISTTGRAGDSTPRNMGSMPGTDTARGQRTPGGRAGNWVGRISAAVNRHFNEIQENRWGLFGFFECEPNADTAAALLDAAEVWLAQRGRDRMVGPMDFSTNDECGLLIEGHELKPIILAP